MAEYLKESIKDFPENCDSPQNTPAGAHLFEVNDDSPKISEAKRKLLHSIVAKLLSVTKRGRPDIQVPIAFLTSRISKAVKDDWKKFKRLLQ
jgi:hypothetical protein